jgi:hypothetical protein
MRPAPPSASISTDFGYNDFETASQALVGTPLTRSSLPHARRSNALYATCCQTNPKRLWRSGLRSSLPPACLPPLASEDAVAASIIQRTQSGNMSGWQGGDFPDDAKLFRAPRTHKRAGLLGGQATSELTSTRRPPPAVGKRMIMSFIIRFRGFDFLGPTSVQTTIAAIPPLCPPALPIVRPWRSTLLD